VECWLITPRSEVRRFDFDDPPEEICLPDKPLVDIEDDAHLTVIQDAPYIIYKRHQLPADSPRLGVVYSLDAPTVGDIQVISAYRAGDESRPKLA
jgi:hypothetical protein